jgi:hypothetical protein
MIPRSCVACRLHASPRSPPWRQIATRRHGRARACARNRIGGLLRWRADALDARLAAAIRACDCRCTGATLTDLDGIELRTSVLATPDRCSGTRPPGGAGAAVAGRPRLVLYVAQRMRMRSAGCCVSASRCRTGRSQRRPPTPIASRCALREAVTHRPRILIMNGCYHGAVDETYVSLQGRSCGQSPGPHGAICRSHRRHEDRRIQ